MPDTGIPKEIDRNFAMSHTTTDALWTPPPIGPVFDDDVVIDAGTALLTGHLHVPAQPLGAVVISHGSETGQFGPINRFLAAVLGMHRLATLGVDLLTTPETVDHLDRIDVELPGSRLLRVKHWLSSNPHVGPLPLGYFGTGSAAGATLWAAAGDDAVSAVVAHGPRPDAAGPRLLGVTAPTLLIVGAHDEHALHHNELTLSLLGHRPHLEVVPEPRYFADSRVLEAAAQLAAAWFADHFNTAD